MRRNLSAGIVIAVLAIAGSRQLAAQELFTPMYKAPYRAFTTYEIGAAFSQPKGYDYALQGNYGIGRGRNDFGLGIAYLSPGGAGDNIFSVGGNFRTRVLQSSQSFPLDGALAIGAGFAFGGGTTIANIPVGITLGRRVQMEGSSMSFVPYVEPTMIPQFGGGSSHVYFDLGLGVDVRLGRNLDVRVSGGLGSSARQGIGVGVNYVK